MEWTKLGPPPSGTKREEMPAPWDGKEFVAAWQHQSGWVYRVCEWNAYAGKFTQVPGRHELMPGGPDSAPVAYWMKPEPPVMM